MFVVDVGGGEEWSDEWTLKMELLPGFHDREHHARFGKSSTPPRCITRNKHQDNVVVVK